MVLIQTTGLDQYAPGGNARLQLMLIGGPGAGKTRYSTFWPKPLIASCESGLASVADRRTPFVEINTSQDMLETLAMMKEECKKPDDRRKYQTFIVDTLDAFQRKVKDEWLLANPNAQSFRGFEAWGYLDAKMQMLLTRLLNLDMNVIVSVHYKDKTIREGSGENQSERQELMLQLSGEVKDSVFNDFDLVGWMGSYWEVEDGQRVEKRGLTFKRTPEKPFLKDRLFITPNWMEIKFEDDDYYQLFAALVARLDEMGETETIGEVPALVPAEQQMSAGVVQPGPGGALPPQDPKDLPLEANDKPALQQIAKALEIPFKANTLKGELIEMIKAKRAETVAPVAPVAVDPNSTTGPAAVVTTVDFATIAPVGETPVESEAHSATLAADLIADKEAREAASAVSTPVQATQIQTPEGVVDVATGELMTGPASEPVSEEQAIKAIEDVLGGQVISQTPVVDAPLPAVETAPPPAPPRVASNRSETCEKCGKVLANEPNKDHVILSYIKYRHDLCNLHYAESKDAGKYVA